MCGDWAFSNSGLEWGCQPVSCRCLQDVTHCRNETCSTCLSKESTPPIPFGNSNSKHPLPARSRFLRGAERSTMSALGLSCPSLRCIFRKKTCPMQRSRVFGHGVVVSKICYNTVIVLSVVLCDWCKPMNNCRHWAFSNSRLEVLLPAFQLPMFAKCDALPKEHL